MLKYIIYFILVSLIINIGFVLLKLRQANIKDELHRSKLIVIDGTDGSGKATQTALLVDYLNNHLKQIGSNKKVVHLAFPNYESTSATLVKEYLADEHRLINTFQSSLFYTVDRVATFTKIGEDGLSLFDKFNNGDYIFICDRYTTSNILHQSYKLNKRQLNRFIKAVEFIEYKLCKLPKPDLVIYLDVEPEVSIKNIIKRYDGDKSKMDAHENITHLTEVYNKREVILDKLKWSRVDCSIDGEMRDIDSVHINVIDLVDDRVINTY